MSGSNDVITELETKIETLRKSNKQLAQDLADLAKRVTALESKKK